MTSKGSNASTTSSRPKPPTKIPRNPASVKFEVTLVGSDAEKIKPTTRNPEVETNLLAEDLNGYLQFCACKASVICIMIPTTTCRHVTVQGTVFCDRLARREVSMLLVKYFHAESGLPSVLGQVAMASQNRDTTDAEPLHVVVERLYINDVPVVNTLDGSRLSAPSLLQIESPEAFAQKQAALPAAPQQPLYAQPQMRSVGSAQGAAYGEAQECPTPSREDPLSKQWGTEDLMREYTGMPTNFSPSIEVQGPVITEVNDGSQPVKVASRNGLRGGNVPQRQACGADATFGSSAGGIQRRSSSAGASRLAAGSNVAAVNPSYPVQRSGSVNSQNPPSRNVEFNYAGSGVQAAYNAPAGRRTPSVQQHPSRLASQRSIEITQQRFRTTGSQQGSKVASPMPQGSQSGQPQGSKIASPVPQGSEAGQPQGSKQPTPMPQYAQQQQYVQQQPQYVQQQPQYVQQQTQYVEQQPQYVQQQQYVQQPPLQVAPQRPSSNNSLSGGVAPMRQGTAVSGQSINSGQPRSRSAEVSHFARQRMLAAEQRGYQAGVQGISAGQCGYIPPQGQATGQRYYNAEQQGYIAGLQDYIAALKMQQAGQPVDPALMPPTPVAPNNQRQLMAPQEMQLVQSGRISNAGGQPI